MEQTTQQITQKPSLPIKTKIAAWWMIVIGGIFWIRLVTGGFLNVAFFFISLLHFRELSGLILFSSFPLFFLIFPFLGFYILKRKGWAWRLTQIILYIGTLLLIFSWLIILRNPRGGASDIQLLFFGATVYTIIIIIPLILLLLDRKNFWKITT